MAKAFVFWGCIVMFGFTLINIASLNEALNMLPRPTITKIYAFYVSTTMLALMGALGSYNDSSKHLKLFSILTLLNAFLLATSTYNFDSSAIIQNLNLNLKLEMSSRQKSYHWAEDVGKSPFDNYFWDNIQWDNKCCGIDNPDDWSIFRPKEDLFLLANYYPQSCCYESDYVRIQGKNQYKVCKSGPDLYKDGCYEKAILALVASNNANAVAAPQTTFTSRVSGDPTAPDAGYSNAPQFDPEASDEVKDGQLANDPPPSYYSLDLGNGAAPTRSNNPRSQS